MSIDNPLNLDQIYGLPSFHIDGNPIYEAGDTGHNTFTLLYCGWDYSPQKALELLTSADNWPLRSPDSRWWYGRPGRCSRDLLTPYLCYVAAHNPPYFKSVKSAMRKHCYLFANNPRPNFRYDSPEEHSRLATPDVPFEPQYKLPDFLGPDIWSIVVRGTCMHSKLRLLAYPVLCLLDLHGLGAAILQYYKQDTDARNQALKTHFSSTYMPTIVSKLAVRIFKASNPLKAFSIHWQKPGEPRVDLWMSRLFS